MSTRIDAAAAAAAEAARRAREEALRRAREEAARRAARERAAEMRRQQAVEAKQAAKRAEKLERLEKTQFDGTKKPDKVEMSGKGAEGPKTAGELQAYKIATDEVKKSARAAGQRLTPGEAREVVDARFGDWVKKAGKAIENGATPDQVRKSFAKEASSEATTHDLGGPTGPSRPLRPDEDIRNRPDIVKMIIEKSKAAGVPPELALMTIGTETTWGSNNSFTAEDHDSLGLYQQRPSCGWGTPQECLDPVHSTEKFLEAAVKYKGQYGSDPASLGAWCQKVQGSAYPDRYQEQYAEAQRVIREVGSSSVTPFSGQGTEIGGGNASGTATKVPHFSQGDPRWGNTTLGQSYTISQAGCALTSAAMAISGATGKNVTPLELDRKHPYSGDGLIWEQVGLTSAGFSLDKIKSELEAGRPVVVGVDYRAGSGGGSNGTDHWVCITGVGKDKDGKEYFSALDPSSPAGSGGQFKFYPDGNGNLKGAGQNGTYTTTDNLRVVQNGGGAALTAKNWGEGGGSGGSYVGGTGGSTGGGSSSVGSSSGGGGGGGGSSSTGSSTSTPSNPVKVQNDGQPFQEPAPAGFSNKELDALIAMMMQMAVDEQGKVTAAVENDPDFRKFMKEKMPNWKPGMKVPPKLLKEFLSKKLEKAASSKGERGTTADLSKAAQAMLKQYAPPVDPMGAAQQAGAVSDAVTAALAGAAEGQPAAPVNPLAAATPAAPGVPATAVGPVTLRG